MSLRGASATKQSLPYSLRTGEMRYSPAGTQSRRDAPFGAPGACVMPRPSSDAPGCPDRRWIRYCILPISAIGSRGGRASVGGRKMVGGARPTALALLGFGYTPIAAASPESRAGCCLRPGPRQAPAVGWAPPTDFSPHMGLKPATGPGARARRRRERKSLNGGSRPRDVGSCVNIFYCGIVLKEINDECGYSEG